MAAIPVNAQGTLRENQWNAVREAIDQGLPKTAIEKLTPIIQRAKEQNRTGELVRAIGQRVILQGLIQGNKAEEKITRMEAEIESASPEAKPILQCILANWYWHYFRQNSWRFLQRTQTDVVPSDDFTEWSLPRILAEIDVQFDQAFEHVDVLKNASVTEYTDLLDNAEVNVQLRPTLFDVLTANALQFYSSGEQAGNQRSDAFQLSADDPIFESQQSFLAWEIDRSDSESLLSRAVQLYQDWIRFHERDEDPSARLDANLARLDFGKNYAFGENKTKRYQDALVRFSKIAPENRVTARALHQIAAVLHGQGNWAEAHKQCQQTIQKHPDTVGANRCFNLIQQIEAKSSSITTERCWTDPWPTIDLNYRNVTKVHFRLVPFDFDQLVRQQRFQPIQLGQKEFEQLLLRAPSKVWSETLPETEDYQPRDVSLDVPRDVARGSYLLIASHNADFSKDLNQLSVAEVWVTKLALVTRTEGDGVASGFVLDAKSGEPIANARVEGWARRRNDPPNQIARLPSVETDRNGMFRFAKENWQNLFVRVKVGADTVTSRQGISTRFGRRNDTAIQQTLFFTDRSIYRPGQIVRYKGICIESQAERDQYRVLGGKSLQVVLMDPNHKEVESKVHVTNDYGSFEGSFTAPRGRLTGQMQLRVEEGPGGIVGIRVEEYKRPKFLVDVEAPQEQARLEKEVVIPGKATAYSGASIGDAKVSYRVVRTVRYPDWWYWRCWWMPPRGGSQEIARGVTTTSSNGTFEIPFRAQPDVTVDRSSEPTFIYRVDVDVTDPTGETRSASRTVQVGYTTITASLSAPSWLTSATPVQINVRTSTLDGVGQQASGKVSIHALKQPDQVARTDWAGSRNRYSDPFSNPSTPSEDPEAVDPTNPNSWPLAERVFEQAFETNGAGAQTLEADLAPGIYRASLETKDEFGNPVTAILPMQVLDPAGKKLGIKIPNLFRIENSSLEPGQKLQAIWGSGYDRARAYVEVEHRGKMIQSYWTDRSNTQVSIQQQVDESMRGGFSVRTTMIRENRAYMENHNIQVPWTNKRLSVEWERFKNKLEPGEKQTWVATIRGPDAEAAAAEMVATLYDASLDVYQPHHWISQFNVFRRNRSLVRSQFHNHGAQMRSYWNGWHTARRNDALLYPELARELVQNFMGYQYMRNRFARGGAMPQSAASGYRQESALAIESKAQFGGFDASRSNNVNGGFMGTEGADESTAPAPDLDEVSVRQNLQETAFFFPRLSTDSKGTVRMEFTMPEALTEWKFIGFAHDRQLRAGPLLDTVVTSKELMIQPNPPRFVREGDEIEFTVKVINQSATRQVGSVRLTFASARTGETVDDQLGNLDRDQTFEVPAGESQTHSWRLKVPDSIGFLTYKAIGSSGRLSDGEQGFLPTLSRRILVTESLPLPIRGKQTKEFSFTKLADSANSESLQHQSLTVQMTSNPSWYAVMALPYLMEFPHECSEQLFNRIYANSLAKKIVDSDPKMERIFEQWRGTKALDSPLFKNQDMKAVLIEETPWLRQADDESQARRNVGILFDNNRLQDELTRAMGKLKEQQLPDGSWPWFPGGRGNDFITLYVTTGFGRLRHLGVDVDVEPAIRSLQRLDNWATETYQQIKEKDLDANHLSASIALYLYGRSFFLADRPIQPVHREAVNYWVGQAENHWLKLANRQSQGHLAIALKRFDQVQAAFGIMASIKERSVSDEELGTFWRDTEASWWWYRAPIETQAIMIEAFDEVSNDQEMVENCKVWLLKQKQTQDWKTTKGTADAVYALLLRGSDLLASDDLVEVSMGGEVVDADDVEAGTGFYEHRISGDAVNSKLAQVTVRKQDAGVAWGSVHWQYLEDISEVTAHDASPLQLSKRIYIKKNTDDGPKLMSVDGPVEVGDELVVRIVLSTDRDMEYLHLKDHRGSGTEPVNVLSRYRFQDGLMYYESTRDTASHFFIDYLPKGKYVFEYSIRVQLRGNYQTGLANIQCMYAPEFNSHSESLPIVVE